MLEAAGLGFLLGVVTGIPLGVINIAIVDAATTGRRRFAIGLGLGGGAADTFHASLAFAGIGRLVLAEPALVHTLGIAAAVLITGYAIVAWRGRVRTAEPRDGGLARGIASGVMLTLPNPGALTAWVSVAAALWPGADLATACVLGAAVGAGSMLWFALLAIGISRVPREHKLVQLIPKLALAGVVVLAIGGVIRAW